MVDWHFACIHNRWTKRALAAAGFGYPAQPPETGESRRWKPIFSVAEIGGDDSAAAAADPPLAGRKPRSSGDIEEGHMSLSGTIARTLSGNVPTLSSVGIGKDAEVTKPADDSEEVEEMSTPSSRTASKSVVAEPRTRTTLSGNVIHGAATKMAPSARVAIVHGVNRPLFHIDLTSALQSAIANVQLRESGGTREDEPL